MKKYIYSIVLSLTIIWSCSDDDYSRVYVDNEIKTEIVGAIEVPRQAAAVGTMVAFNYTLPQSFEVESTVEVTAKSAFGILDINANKSISYITVPAGTTTGTAYFEMPGSENDTNNNYNGIEEYATVSLTGIALTQPEEGSIDDPFTLTSNQESVTGLNLHSNYMSPNDDILTISLDWQGPWDQNDFDLYIDNAAGDNFESVETGSRFEGVYFNETEHPDGTYIITIAIYTSVDDNPVPWRLTLTQPDGTPEIYEGTVDPTIGFVEALTFTKSTDSEGNITFVSSSL